MNVLWITNIVFPEAKAILNKADALKASGGWLIGAADALVENAPKIKLAVASISREVDKLTILYGKTILFYLIPHGSGNLKYNKEYEPYWKEIYETFHPDIVHIHGSEFSHGLAYVNSCGTKNVVVSIQGLPTVYKEHYYDGLTYYERMSLTLFGLLSHSKINGYRNYCIQSKNEVALLQKVSYIIGRTSWDKAHTWAINPKAKYFKCNETLRKEFYSGCWYYSKCKPHSIFLSQIEKPIKGFHQLLKALPLVLKHYPDTTVYIAGTPIPKRFSIKDLFVRRYFRLAKKYILSQKLAGALHFIGPQDALGIKNALLNSNIFLSPSSIENSPNSLGEAQLLGVPCLSSFVGGVDSMIPSYLEGQMYRYSDTTMLAYKICELFEASASLDNESMRKNALHRHNPKENAEQTIKIYNTILSDK